MEKRILPVDTLAIAPNSLVKVTQMNHIVELQYLEKENNKAHIRKIDSDRYVYLETGEIRDFEKTETRAQGENSLRKTFRKMRELINTNFNGSKNELFVTLTYRGDLQTNDTKIVYEDFKNFMKRLKYHFKDVSTIDYINVLEPHASGNFHMHVLLRFNEMSSVYIPNDTLAKLWGNGFVTIQSLEGVDNIGAYLSAYLTDIEITNEQADQLADKAEIVEKNAQGQAKKFVKGARLKFYPTGVNIYRKSKGIIEPKVEKMSYKNAQKKLGEATPNFKYGVELIDNEKDFRNTIIKEQYNLKRQ